MNEAKELIAELKQLMGKTDTESEARRDEIAEWFKANNSEENARLMQEFLDDGLEEVRAEIGTLRRQIEDEDYRLLPISYIAEHYFGKSQAWLSQRINGIPVRGRVYTLNAEQKQIFNTAMQDISKKFGSFRLQ